MEKILLYFSLKYNGDFYKVYDALKTKENIDINELIQLKRNLRYKYITMIDRNYPEYLKRENRPPIVLFYEGNLSLVDSGLPIKNEMLENGHRMISTVKPIEHNGKIIFDYVVACENQDDLKFLIDHIKSKGLTFKDYSKHKELER